MEYEKWGPQFIGWREKDLHREECSKMARKAI
jgi:hypothetical protein